MGKKWIAGPNENSRWHPEGACIRFRFTLSSGSYATTLLREFMQCPLSQIWESYCKYANSIGTN